MAGTVFRLREHVGRHVPRPGRVIRQHQQIAGAGQQVNGHPPHQQALGHADVGVARTENLLHAADGFRAACQRGHGLRTAHAINLRGPGGAGRIEDCRVDRAILAAGGGDHDFPAPGHLGQGDGHQGGGNQRRGAAGNINADALEGIELLPHCRPVGIPGLPGLAQGFFGEVGDVLFRLGDGGAQGFIRRQGRVKQFGLGHRELLDSQFGQVKFGGEFQDRLIAARRHLGENGLGALLNLGIEQAGVGGKLAEFRGKILLGVPGNFHGRRVAKKRGQVKRRDEGCMAIKVLFQGLLRKVFSRDPGWG